LSGQLTIESAKGATIRALRVKSTDWAAHGKETRNRTKLSSSYRQTSVIVHKLGSPEKKTSTYE
jgi:hypothetical protein